MFTFSIVFGLCNSAALRDSRDAFNCGNPWIVLFNEGGFKDSFGLLLLFLTLLSLSKMFPI